MAKQSPLTVPMEQAVGRLISCAGIAEFSLALQVLRMMAHPEGFQSQQVALVSGMQINVKLRIIRAYAELHVPKEKKDISTMCDEIRKSFEFRNKIAHSLLTHDRGNPDIKIISLEQNLFKLKDIEFISISTINAGADSILASVRILGKKLTQLGFRPHQESLSLDPRMR